MAAGAGVFGPYEVTNKHGVTVGYKVIIRDPNGSRSVTYATEQEALDGKEEAEVKRVKVSKSIGDAIDSYCDYVRETNGDRESTAYRLSTCLRLILVDHLDKPLKGLTLRLAQDAYDDLRVRPIHADKPEKLYAVATTQSCLKKARAFGNWLVERRWAKENVFKPVKYVGRANKGKPQMRIDDARKVFVKAIEWASSEDALLRGKGLGVVIAVVIGVRPGEIVSRRVRDIDEDGTVLVVDDDSVDEEENVFRLKASNSRRAIEIPESLWTVFELSTKGKNREDSLVGYIDPDTVGRACLKLAELVGVASLYPKRALCPTAMRGAVASRRLRAGEDAAQIARDLGHTPALTTGTYAEPGAVQTGAARRALAVLQGGRR